MLLPETFDLPEPQPDCRPAKSPRAFVFPLRRFVASSLRRLLPGASMIVNAKLQRVDAPSGASAAGDRSWTTGSSIDVPCCLDDVSDAQKFSVGNVIADATAVLYVLLSKLPAGVTIVKEAMALVQLGGFTARLYQVIYMKDRVHADQSHAEVFLKAL
jgi:hypothetical protein